MYLHTLKHWHITLKQLTHYTLCTFTTLKMFEHTETEKPTHWILRHTHWICLHTHWKTACTTHWNLDTYTVPFYYTENAKTHWNWNANTLNLFAPHWNHSPNTLGLPAHALKLLALHTETLLHTVHFYHTENAKTHWNIYPHTGKESLTSSSCVLCCFSGESLFSINLLCLWCFNCVTLLVSYFPLC